MEHLEQAMDDILASNPEFTLREVCFELVKAGDLEHAAIEDAYVLAALQHRFAAAKARANFGRVNTDI